MIDRINFIRGAIVSLLTLLGLKLPLEASEPKLCGICGESPCTIQCSMDRDEQCDSLWPNDKPFPCVCPPRPCNRDCGACRGDHNRFIVSTDPEWYNNVHVVDLTGHWWQLSEGGVTND